jgi:hypothetical protein
LIIKVCESRGQELRRYLDRLGRAYHAKTIRRRRRVGPVGCKSLRHDSDTGTVVGLAG